MYMYVCVLYLNEMQFLRNQIGYMRDCTVKQIGLYLVSKLTPVQKWLLVH